MIRFINNGSEKFPVKLFNSEKQMQTDPNPKDGDLAIVYGDTFIRDMTKNDHVQTIYFPDIVTLPKATSSIDIIELKLYNGPILNSSDGIRFSDTEFSFTISSLPSSVYVEYTSEDGITYTKTYRRKLCNDNLSNRIIELE